MHTIPVYEILSSRMIFILAAAGSAVGLANIWRFTYATGANGICAFVMIYLVSICLITIPIRTSELLIGGFKLVLGSGMEIVGIMALP